MVKDNAALQRFELEVEGQLAIAVYYREPGVITFTHTEVPDQLRGKGVGSELVKGALDLVQRSGSKVVARCSFVAAYIRRHPELASMIQD